MNESDWLRERDLYICIGPKILVIDWVGDYVPEREMRGIYFKYWEPES